MKNLGILLGLFVIAFLTGCNSVAVHCERSGGVLRRTDERLEHHTACVVDVKKRGMLLQEETKRLREILEASPL